MKEKKSKVKYNENKTYKRVRRILSLGIAIFLLLSFSNQMITWLSAGVGFLFEKGLIGFTTMSSIVSFFGSTIGVILELAIFGGLSYLFSNILLKQGKRLASFISRKIKGIKSNNNDKVISESKKVETSKTKESENKKEEKVNVVSPSNPIVRKPMQKTLGIHPSMRR